MSEYTVRLSHCKNPDFAPSGYWNEKPTVRASWVVVSSIAEASEACLAFIDLHDLGGGNWNGGDLRDSNGKDIGRISYNGRAWNTNGEEIQ